MGKDELWPPMTSKSMIFQIWIVYDYVPEIYISANFHLNPFSRGCTSDRWNVTVLWLFSQLVAYIVFFMGHAPRLNPWIDFHSLPLIRRAFAQGRSFWGLWQYRNSFREQIPQNSPESVVSRQFQAKWTKYKNHNILQSGAWSTCNFRRLLAPSNTNRCRSVMTF